MRLQIIGLAVCASALAIALFGVPLAVAVLQYALQAERNPRSVADAVAIVVAGASMTRSRSAMSAGTAPSTWRCTTPTACCWVAGRPQAPGEALRPSPAA